MSRTGVSQKPSEGWVMECDHCFTRTEIRPLQDDFPLIEFARKGWMIGETTDACGVCVSQGKSVRKPWTLERLERNLEQTRAHSLKFYGREPLSAVVDSTP